MYRSILVPLDGSELAECSLSHAKAIAKGCSAAELILLRVVEPISPQTVRSLMEVGDDALRMIDEENMRDAKDYISQLEGRLQADGFICRGVVKGGRASDEIMDFSRKGNVDLIVMSTHGRSGLSRFYFGSVSERVSRHSPIPVLMVTPQGCRVMQE